MTGGAGRRPDIDADAALRPSGFFAFRVPALPMSVLTGWADGVEAAAVGPEQLSDALGRDRVLLRERLDGVVNRSDVQRALSVASPDLLDARRDRGSDPGVVAALVRYVSRMASRPTPYGTFAACGVGVIGEGTRIEVPDPEAWQAHTQLDADYLDAVVRDASARLRARLRFRTNDSLHLMGGRWRYVESRLEGLERSYRLLQVADSKHLQRALEAARDGATLAAVADAVAVGGVDADRAAAYASQLADAQVLVPSLALTLTGPPPLDALIADLESLGDEETVSTLAAVRDDLTDRGLDYDRLAARLASSLPPTVDRARLFHVTLTVPPCGATLGRSMVEDVARAVELLRGMAPAREDTELDAFRDAFQERYDELEVPLLEALDEELGIGFGAESARPDPVPLLDGLRFPGRSRSQSSFGPREVRLLELLHRAWTDAAHEVALSAADVEALAGDDEPPPLPAALAATAVLARTTEGPRVVVTGADGPSGARLLGRFCHSDPELARHVREHLRAEEALDREAVYAEIVHLPTGRLVNVVARPVLRDHELEWLGRSGARRDRVIPASDLLLSLRDGRFVLRSRTMDRRVVPRLTSAHNYNRRSPGVYRFLAAVQSDGCVGRVGWTWYPFDAAPFTPRVRRGPVVLALARWRAGGAELRALDGADARERWQAVFEWRGRRHLPRWICLVELDNVLPFDLENALSVDAFIRTVRSKDDVLLEELFPGPEELVAAGPDGPRAVEVVVPFVRAAAVPAPAPPVASSAPARRTFPPGSEWTYLKLYTGSATADRLLTEEIGPCVRALVAAGATDQWFFLRYEDPLFHLRIRAHGDPDRIRTGFEALAARAIDEGLASDAQFGTYVREIERYGGAQGIVVAERMFHADSDAVVDVLDRCDPGGQGLDARWRIGLLGADRLLADLGLSLPARLELARAARARFERELRADSRLRKDVAARVRAELPAIEDLMPASAGTGHPLARGIAVLDERSAQIAPLAVQLGDLAEVVAPSLVHMWLNRLCRSESRRQEYVIYAMLVRVYEVRQARARS